MPLDTFKRLVFPAPFGPMIPMIRPRGKTIETSLSAWTPPNDKLTLRSSRAAVMPPPPICCATAMVFTVRSSGAAWLLWGWKRC